MASLRSTVEGVKKQNCPQEDISSFKFVREEKAGWSFREYCFGFVPLR